MRRALILPALLALAACATVPANSDSPPAYLPNTLLVAVQTTPTADDVNDLRGRLQPLVEGSGVTVERVVCGPKACSELVCTASSCHVTLARAEGSTGPSDADLAAKLVAGSGGAVASAYQVCPDSEPARADCKARASQLGRLGDNPGAPPASQPLGNPRLF